MVLVGLPLFLFFTDFVNLFATGPPPKPHAGDHHHHPHSHQQPKPQVFQQSQTLDFPSQNGIGVGPIGSGHTVTIDFCTSCSFKGTAVTMKNMLESQFPGIYVALANYPPSPPKRILGKIVPVIQIGSVIALVGGDQIFPRLGITPPPLYYRIRANKFGPISAIWLLGNFLQSSLQSTGAFEVYLDGELVFSKLNQQRFPGEIELRETISKRLKDSTIMNYTTDFGGSARVLKTIIT
ncbi:hypothetical protein V2J09_010356 [Rumex salicifolius]